MPQSHGNVTASQCTNSITGLRMQLTSMCEFKQNGRRIMSEGQTQCLSTLRGAIHVVLLPVMVSDICSIKINVLVITVMFLCVGHKRAAKQVTSRCFQFTISRAVFFFPPRKTCSYYTNLFNSTSNSLGSMTKPLIFLLKQ